MDFESTNLWIPEADLELDPLPDLAPLEELVLFADTPANTLDHLKAQPFSFENFAVSDFASQSSYSAPFSPSSDSDSSSLINSEATCPSNSPNHTTADGMNHVPSTEYAQEPRQAKLKSLALRKATSAAPYDVAEIDDDTPKRSRRPRIRSRKQLSVDEQLAKKERRMLRNRESAALSRKKKKEQMDTLNTLLEDTQNENKILRTENDLLRKEIIQLRAQLRAQVMGSGGYQGVSSLVKPVVSTFMVCLFCFSLFGSPVSFGSSSFSSSSLSSAAVSSSVSSNSQLAPLHRGGRALMSVSPVHEPNESLDANSRATKSLEKLLEGLLIRNSSKSNDLSSHIQTSSESSDTSSAHKSQQLVYEIGHLDDQVASLPAYRVSDFDMFLLYKTFASRMDTSFTLCKEIVVLNPDHLIDDAVSILLPSALPSIDNEIVLVDSYLSNATSITLSALSSSLHLL